MQKGIDQSINNLKKINNYYDNKYENIIFKQKKILKEYYELTSNLYLNNFIKKIKELNESLNNNLYDINFMPPPINNFTDSSVDLLKSSFYQENNNEDKIENKNDGKEKADIIMCSLCNINESICFCEHCNSSFCKSCLDLILAEKEKGNDHRIFFLDEIKQENEKIKTLFLKSIKNIIEDILIKTNYILNKEMTKKSILNSNSSKNLQIDYIIKIIKYPYIKNFKDLNSQIDFLKEINLNAEREMNDNNENLDNSFHISEVNKELILTIKDIFIDENINLFKSALSSLDKNFYLDDESYEKLEINKNDEIKKNFYYSIEKNDSIAYTKKSSIEEIINSFKINSLNDNNNKALFINKSFCIDNFIRTKEFSDYTFEKIRNDFPNIYQLIEYKLIVNDYFCNQCDIKNYLDFRGNFIIPNKNLNLYRGTEKYDPPYGWIGIGLKVLGKYDNDDWITKKDKSSKWAIAYHGVGRISSYDEIIFILKKIITKEGLKPGQSQIKFHSMDIRHKGKKIGTGVYLTQRIDIAEEYSGLIMINNKLYKIVLMARVLIDKIKEPEDFNYWILNPDYIRVYRILLKEKN